MDIILLSLVFLTPFYLNRFFLNNKNSLFSPCILLRVFFLVQNNDVRLSHYTFLSCSLCTVCSLRLRMDSVFGGKVFFWFFFLFLPCVVLPASSVEGRKNDICTSTAATITPWEESTTLCVCVCVRGWRPCPYRPKKKKNPADQASPLPPPPPPLMYSSTLSLT